MSTYRVEMHRSPTISDEEARRRLAAVYRLLLDLAAQSERDAPAESARTGAGAPEGESVADRRVQSTPEPASAQIE
jgi:hypothetical protein